MKYRTLLRHLTSLTAYRLEWIKRLQLYKEALPQNRAKGSMPMGLSFFQLSMCLLSFMCNYLLTSTKIHKINENTLWYSFVNMLWISLQTLILKYISFHTEMELMIGKTVGTEYNYMRQSQTNKEQKCFCCHFYHPFCTLNPLIKNVLV